MSSKHVAYSFIRRSLRPGYTGSVITLTMSTFE